MKNFLMKNTKLKEQLLLKLSLNLVIFKKLYLKLLILEELLVKLFLNLVIFKKLYLKLSKTRRTTCSKTIFKSSHI